MVTGVVVAPAGNCPNLRSAIAWAFLEPGICLGDLGVLERPRPEGSPAGAQRERLVTQQAGLGAGCPSGQAE